MGARSGLTRDEFAEKYPAEHAAWLAGRAGPAVPGDETADRGGRAGGARPAGAASSALAPGETGVVVLHGACLRVGAVRAPGLAVEALEATARGMDNCAWAILREQPDHGSASAGVVQRDGRVRERHPVDFASDTPVG